jgi:hypothetical protein
LKNFTINLTGPDSHLPDVQVLVRVVREGVQGIHREQQQVEEHGEKIEISQRSFNVQSFLSGAVHVFSHFCFKFQHVMITATDFNRNST